MYLLLLFEGVQNSRFLVYKIGVQNLRHLDEAVYVPFFCLRASVAYAFWECLRFETFCIVPRSSAILMPCISLVALGMVEPSPKAIDGFMPYYVDDSTMKGPIDMGNNCCNRKSPMRAT